VSIWHRMHEWCWRTVLNVMLSLIQRFLLAVALTTASASLYAEGLSWTDANKDRICNKNLPQCPYAVIGQTQADGSPPKVYTLHIVVRLFPGLPENYANSVSMKVVVETADQVKHTYSQDRLPITLEQISNPGDNPITARFCSFDIQLGDLGAIAVLGIDAAQLDDKGNALARHEFR